MGVDWNRPKPRSWVRSQSFNISLVFSLGSSVWKMLETEKKHRFSLRPGLNEWDPTQDRDFSRFQSNVMSKIRLQKRRTYCEPILAQMPWNKKSSCMHDIEFYLIDLKVLLKNQLEITSIAYKRGFTEASLAKLNCSTLDWRKVPKRIRAALNQRLNLLIKSKWWTSTLCMRRVAKFVAVLVSHTLTVVSLEAVNNVCPLPDNTMSFTQSVCCDNEFEYGSWLVVNLLQL